MESSTKAMRAGVLRPDARADGVRVFSATLLTEIARVGERATAWLGARAEDIEVTEVEIAQTSCRAFHCYSLLVWFRRRAPTALRAHE